MSSNRKLLPSEALPPSFEGGAFFPIGATVVTTVLGVVAANAVNKFGVEAMLMSHINKYFTPTNPYALSLLAVLFVIKGIQWMSFHTVRARVIHGVPWPNLYATKTMTTTYNEYNSVQRTHQNSLELLTGYVFFQLVSALGYPYISGVTGLLFGVSRIMYAFGYMSGKPAKRAVGLWGFFAIMLLEGLSIYYVAEQLGFKVNIL